MSKGTPVAAASGSGLLLNNSTASERFPTTTNKSFSRHLASSKEIMEHVSIDKTFNGALLTGGTRMSSSKIGPIYSNNMLKTKSSNRSSFTRPNTGSGSAIRTVLRIHGKNKSFHASPEKSEAPSNVPIE